MDLNLLYHLCKPIPENLLSLNKYTQASLYYPIRFLTLETLLTYKSQTSQDPPQYLTELVSSESELVLIPSIINRQVVTAVIRSIHSKRFQTLLHSISYPFGIGQLQTSFTYLKPILVVEGVGDLLALKPIYPNVVATLTSGLSKTQLSILQLLTNHLILAYDNDEAGNKSFYRDRKRILALNMQVSRLNNPAHYKDPGQLLDSRLLGQSIFLEEAMYKHQINIILSNII